LAAEVSTACPFGLLQEVMNTAVESIKREIEYLFMMRDILIF